MSRPIPLETLAHRWAAAKDEVGRLKRKRGLLRCVNEYSAGPIDDGDVHRSTEPCWKLTRFDPDDCDMPGPVT